MTIKELYHKIMFSKAPIAIKEIESFRERTRNDVKLKCINVVQIMLNDIGPNSNPGPIETSTVIALKEVRAKLELLEI